MLQSCFLHQFCQRYVQRVGYFGEGQYRDIVIATFYPTDITSIYFCYERQIFLRDSL